MFSFWSCHAVPVSTDSSALHVLDHDMGLTSAEGQKLEFFYEPQIIFLEVLWKSSKPIM
jgi:hypothetical protein